MCDALLPHSCPQPIFASSQESTVRGRCTSPRTSGQSRLGPREFGEDAPSVPSTPTPFCCTTTGTSIVPLKLTPPSMSRWLTRTIRLSYAIQFARRPPKFNCVLDTSVAVRKHPCLVQGDCCPPGKGCNRAGPSSRDEAGASRAIWHPQLQSRRSDCFI